MWCNHFLMTIHTLYVNALNIKIYSIAHNALQWICLGLKFPVWYKYTCTTLLYIYMYFDHHNNFKVLMKVCRFKSDYYISKRKQAVFGSTFGPWKITQQSWQYILEKPFNFYTTAAATCTQDGCLLQLYLTWSGPFLGPCLWVSSVE